jgi:hypothetical protein
MGGKCERGAVADCIVVFNSSSFRSCLQSLVLEYTQREISYAGRVVKDPANANGEQAKCMTTTAELIAWLQKKLLWHYGLISTRFKIRKV